MTGMAVFSSNVDSVAANVTAASLPTTSHVTCWTASGMTGFTLPGMIELPGCSAGQRELGQSRRGARTEQPQVAGDLVEREGDDLGDGAGLDHRVLRRLGLEVVDGLGQGQAHVGGEDGDDAAGEPRRRVEAGADRRAAQRELAEPGQHVEQALASRARPGGPSRRPPGRR